MASVGGWVSPPELDGSGGTTTTTSSKSSSQPSSFQLDDGGVCGDMGHFEEIGLDDDHDPHQHKQQQHTHSRDIGAGRRGVGKMRELTQKRPSILTEQHHLGPPPPPPLRCRPPTTATISSSSLAGATSTGPASKNAHRSPSPTMLRRVSSVGRKTVEEIENEYDSDDDVPPDTIFYNVPLSPRSARALSAAASPERDSPVVQLPRPGETATPSMSEEARGEQERGRAEFRGKSWSDAMEQLGDEAKELSEALERHADLEMEQTEKRLQMSCEKNRSSSSVGSGSTVAGAAHTIATSQGAIRHLTTTATSTVPPPLPLPPLQMTNGMIDPLPISKEKEAVLSRTRPSWLPPKSKEEEKRHLKEYKQMMRLSQQADRKRAEKERIDQECKDRAKVDTHKLWDQHIIPNWSIATRKNETRELWWQGIAPRCRGTAWQLAFGNSLAVGPETFRLALKRAREVENGLKKSPTMYSFKERDLFGAIRRDVGKIFPELKIFQETGPLHQSLLEVLMAYSMYRSDVGYVFGTHVVAGLLLLNLSPEESFVTLVNLLNRPLPLAFYTRDDAAMSRVYDLFLKTFNYKLPSLFQHIHVFLNLPPPLYLEAMFVTLFSLHCPIDIASRVWDVYSFEGDSVLVRAAIAVLTVLEPRLYGDAGEVVGILGWGAKGCWELGREDAFMALVRQAGRGEPPS